MTILSDPKVQEKFDSFPQPYKDKLLALRELIIHTAEEIGIEKLEETLKWGEPSYLTKDGSTLRLNMVKKVENTYALYFKCTSNLIPTIREIYRNSLVYENNRAIYLDVHEKQLPLQELKVAIAMALRYHKLKKQPLLGYSQ